MNDLTTSALAAANKNLSRLTRIQVYHLTAAGLLGLDEEGNFIVTPKAEKKVARGKNKAMVTEWATPVTDALKELIKDDTTTIRVDDVWKFLGSPDKSSHNTSGASPTSESSTPPVLTGCEGIGASAPTTSVVARSYAR